MLREKAEGHLETYMSTPIIDPLRPFALRPQGSTSSWWQSVTDIQWPWTQCGSMGFRSIMAQPLCQRVGQHPRVRIGDDLQASGPDLMAHRPRGGRMRRCGPDHIARRTRRLAAEAVAEFDTSELTTGMTAAFTHNGNSHNAASTWHPFTASLRHCLSATSTRGRERWRLAIRN
jgi:hypothetical protein